MSLLKKTLLATAIMVAIPATAFAGKKVSTELYFYNLTNHPVEISYSDKFPISRAGDIYLQAPKGMTTLEIPANKKDTPVWAFEMSHHHDNHVTGTFKIGIKGSTQPSYFNYNIGYHNNNSIAHWSGDTNPQLIDLTFNGKPLTNFSIVANGKKPPCPLINTGRDEYVAMCTIAIVPHNSVTVPYGFAPLPAK